jgi:hypothetical protein
VSTNRGGIVTLYVTLYDNSFECLESYRDNDGRVAMIVIGK